MPVGTHGTILIRTLRDGTHEARARFRDYDGERRQVRAHGASKIAATNALKAKLAERKAVGGAAISTDAKLDVVIDAWLREVEESDLAIGTRRVYELTAEKHIRPAVGNLHLREATVPALDRCLRAVRDNHGRGAAKTARSVLSGVLNVAVRNGAITANPVRETISLPAERKSATRALTVSEVDHLVDLMRSNERAVKWDLPDLAEWMLYTGCRIGEALAAADEVLDLEHATWEVNATVIRVKGEGLIVQQRTKTDAGWRVLALPPGAVEMIKRRRAEKRLHAPNGIVFGAPQAKSLRDPSNTSADLRAVLSALGCITCNGSGYTTSENKRTGCTHVGPFAWATSHTFRKTVATRLDEAGVSARAIADQLGHAKPSMTQDVYMGRNVVNAAAAALLDR